MHPNWKCDKITDAQYLFHMKLLSVEQLTKMKGKKQFNTEEKNENEICNVRLILILVASLL